ncbi:MAG: hypothetical protein K2Q10_12610 [Rhodospirillales bacterium]|nr:hypothetical protein [Rhodospirillales bacterium]
MSEDMTAGAAVNGARTQMNLGQVGLKAARKEEESVVAMVSNAVEANKGHTTATRGQQVNELA